MQKSNLHFQTKFSKFTQNEIRSAFSIPQEEKIVLAVWFGKLFECKTRERGFIFTENAFFWNLHGNLTKITAENDEIVSMEQSKEIVVKKGEHSYNLFFPEKISNEEMELLKNLLTKYFADFKSTKTLSPDIENLDESSSVRFALFAVGDFFKQISGKSSDGEENKSSDETNEDKLDSENSSSINESEERKSVENESASSNPDSTNEKSTKNNKKAKKAKDIKEVKESVEEKVSIFVKSGHFVRHIFDVATDLVLVLAIVLALKPALFNSPKVENEDKDAVLTESPIVEVGSIADVSAQNNSEKASENENYSPLFEDSVPIIPLDEGEKILVPDEFLTDDAVSDFKTKSDVNVAKVSEDEFFADEKDVSKDSVKEAKRQLKEAKKQEKAAKREKHSSFWKNYWRSFVCFAVFIIMKSLIISSSKKSKKALCGIIILAIGVLTIFEFIPKIVFPFGIYLILLMVMLLCLQFAMCFNARVIGRKVIWFVLLGFVGYICIHASLPDFAENMSNALVQIKEALQMLDLPVKWW